VFRTTFTSLKNRVQSLPVPDVCLPGAAVCGFSPPTPGFVRPTASSSFSRDDPLPDHRHRYRAGNLRDQL